MWHLKVGMRVFWEDQDGNLYPAEIVDVKGGHVISRETRNGSTRHFTWWEPEGYWRCGAMTITDGVQRTVKKAAPPRIPDNAGTSSTTHWMTRDGALVSIASMEDGHLSNCERVVRSRGREGTPQHEALLAEMRRRGLDPLPLGKPDDQQVRDAVTTLHSLWNHLDTEQKVHLIRTTLRGFFVRTVGAHEIGDACEVWNPGGQA